jgi:MFS family permease
MNQSSDDPTEPRESRPWPARLPFFYGWIILPSAALAMFVSGPGQTFSVSLFVDPLIDEFGWSRTAISGLYTAGSLTAASSMLGIGWLLDRFGARVVLAGVGVMLGLAALWMSEVTNQLGVYAGFSALRMFGQGSLGLVPSSLVALWFVRKRGRATAIAGLGMVMSQALFPPLIHTLNTQIGWRQTWVVLGIIVWVVLIPVAVVFVRRTPESIGLLPDGAPPPSPAQAPQATGGVTQRFTIRSGPDDWTLREALRTRTFWLVFLAAGSQSLVSTALIFHQVAVLDSRGLSAGVSAVVLSVMGPVSLAGAMAGGFLSDRFPNRLLLLAGQAILGVGVLLAILMDQTWQALIYGGVIGFSSGSVITVAAVIWPNYYGRKHLGSIRGAATMAMVAGAALGPLPFALTFDLTGSYTSVLVIFMVFPALSMVAALFAFPPKRRALPLSS